MDCICEAEFMGQKHGMEAQIRSIATEVPATCSIHPNGWNPNHAYLKLCQPDSSLCLYMWEKPNEAANPQDEAAKCRLWLGVFSFCCGSAHISPLQKANGDCHRQNLKVLQVFFFFSCQWLTINGINVFRHLLQATAKFVLSQKLDDLRCDC